MKKLIAFVAVCGFALAFVACGKKAETAETVDSAAVAPAPVVADTTVADSAAVAVDSAAH
ncbi:PG1828 family lipoprotein [Chryseolinea lacunae]|uniref:Lipoprotein n=1 Tax=Chryseolinea lacunae TaxID=2801331 RepID=A0ABS1KPT1_9BACT|nr:hypothetical protein [Chryseolinea lacunae]MBL0741479.1 hypothetical protein [Chryseolinea lacunae]